MPDPEDVFAKAFSDQNRKLSPRESLGAIVFVTTVVMPVITYTRSATFESYSHPRLLFCALLAIGAAVSLCVVERGWRRAFGIVSGALMGLGGALMVILTYARFPGPWETPYVRLLVLIFVLTVGAFPGLMLHMRFRPGNDWHARN